MSNTRHDSGNDAMTALRDAAKKAIPLIENPSGIITGFGFFILLGGLSLFASAFGDGGTFFSIMICVGAFAAAMILGFGFVRTEKAANIALAIGHQQKVLLILALVAIGGSNLIIGLYRSQMVSVDMNEANRTEIQTKDGVIQSMLKEKENLQTHVVNDGAVGNDAAAMARMSEIDQEISTREASLIEQMKPLADGKYNTAVLSILATISLVFSAACQLAYGGSDNPPPSGSRTARRSPTPSGQQKRSEDSGTTGQPSEKSRKRDAGSSTSRGSGRGGLNAANTTIQRNKLERMKLLEEYIDRQPDATLSEMADVIGVSSRETVRRYLTELGHRPQFSRN